jgi:outer membrane protein assembly factor BamB
LGLLGVLLSLAGSVRAENWPQWRGTRLDGISNEKGLPTQWDDKTNIVWQVPLPGIGSSTPIVHDKLIFLTSQDGDDLVLLAYSTGGKELWKRKLGTTGGKMRGPGGEGNDASPTACTDGSAVYAYVGTGDFAAFDFAGKELWRFDPQARYGKFRIQFGMHSTPVLHGDRIYMQFIHSGGAWVIAINKKDGETVWKAARKSDGRAECEHSYASPTIWQNGRDAYLITHGNDYAIAHKLEDGSEIWRVGDLNPKDSYNPTLRFVASPVATPDLIVVPSAKRRSVVGVKPDAKGSFGVGSPYEQWRMPKNTPDVPSPLVVDGLVYLCGEDGVLTCLEAKTGKQLYSQRTHNQRHRGSPVYADGKVYLTARDATVTVVQAGPEFKVVSSNKLPGTMTASPAISNGRIYLRSWSTLYAIGAK